MRAGRGSVKRRLRATALTRRPRITIIRPMDPREIPRPTRDEPTPAPPPLSADFEPKTLAVRTDAAGLARSVSAVCPFCDGVVTPADDRCPRCAAKVVPPHAKPMEMLRSNAKTVYWLQFFSFLCGVTGIIGLVMAYSNRKEARDTWLDSHYEWQIDTFWGMFWLGLVSAVVLGVGENVLGSGVLGQAPGLLVSFGTIAWYMNRVIKGWSRLSDGDPVTDY